MANWIDWIVVGIVVAFGLTIFYKALKEPMDMFFAMLGRVFGKIGDWLSGGVQKSTEITYG